MIDADLDEYDFSDFDAVKYQLSKINDLWSSSCADLMKWNIALARENELQKKEITELKNELKKLSGSNIRKKK